MANEAQIKAQIEALAEERKLAGEVDDEAKEVFRQRMIALLNALEYGWSPDKVTKVANSLLGGVLKADTLRPSKPKAAKPEVKEEPTVKDPKDLEEIVRENGNGHSLPNPASATPEEAQTRIAKILQDMGPSGESKRRAVEEISAWVVALQFFNVFMDRETAGYAQAKPARRAAHHLVNKEVSLDEMVATLISTEGGDFRSPRVSPQPKEAKVTMDPQQEKARPSEPAPLNGSAGVQTLDERSTTLNNRLDELKAAEVRAEKELIGIRMDKALVEDDIARLKPLLDRRVEMEKRVESTREPIAAEVKSEKIEDAKAVVADPVTPEPAASPPAASSEPAPKSTSSPAPTSAPADKPRKGPKWLAKFDKSKL